MNEAEADSVEVRPNVTAELNEKGELIGMEILDGSVFVLDSLFEQGNVPDSNGWLHG